MVSVMASVCIRYTVGGGCWIRANVKQPYTQDLFRLCSRSVGDTRPGHLGPREIVTIFMAVDNRYPPLLPPSSSFPAAFKQKLLTSWKIMAALKSISLPDIFASWKFTLLLPRYLFIFIAAIGLLSYRHWQRRMHCKSRVYGANDSIALLSIPPALRVYLSHGSRSASPPSSSNGGGRR